MRARLDHIDPIIVVDHDPAWAGQFVIARQQILDAAGDFIVRLEHIGSTAVPGLAAKPVIDMLAGVESLEVMPALAERLGPLGYELRDHGEPDRGYLRRKVAGVRTHHLHVVRDEELDDRDEVVLRDWLRQHPDDAAGYEHVKRVMARQFHADREAYVTSKTAVVTRILARARR